MEASYTGTGPGKTSPRLIEDLLDYDASKHRPDSRNLLADPPPIYREKKIFPLRTLPNDCHHSLWRKEGQTSVQPFDVRPDTATKNVSASFCSRCLQHFDVVVDYTKRPGRAFSCVPDSSYPLHHWQHVKSHVPSEEERQSPTWKYEIYREQHTWACSSPWCPAVLTIRISPPRLNKAQTALLTDPRKLYARGVNAIEQDPERLAESRPSLPCEALAVTRTYLMHALGNEDGKARKIAARNKRFLLAYGDECYDLLRYLNFNYHTERVMNNDVEEEEGFWTLPAVASQEEWTGDISKKNSRCFVEDALCEISQRLADRPPDELKKGNTTILYNPLPGLRDLRIVLGCLEYATNTRVVNLDAMEHPHYQSLGACSNFADELIFFAFERQRTCDLALRPYYLECLQGIAAGRESMFLQEEYVKICSLGENTLTEIEDAYKFFALNSSVDHGDDHIIGVYKSRVENAPLQREQAKQALLVIGKARNSVKIEEAASDKNMTYEEALRYFGVTAESPSDVIEAQAVAMAIDQDKRIVAPILSVIANTRNDLTLQVAAASMDAGESELNLSLSEAYKRLQIQDEYASEESVYAYYQTLAQNASEETKQRYLEALRVIAKARNSNFLFAKISDPNATVAALRSTADQPVGLDNIGNTCYLNSLLQYYYSIRAVREAVMNFEDYRMPLTVESVSKKRVGGRAVGKDEIIKGQRFVEELRILYQNLKSASSQSVKPTVDLAELTLFSTATEANYRRASIHSPSAMPNQSIQDEGAASGPELPPSPHTNNSPPPVPARPAPGPSEDTQDVEMTDQEPRSTINDDANSEKTLITPAERNGVTFADTPNMRDAGAPSPEEQSVEPPTVRDASVETPAISDAANSQAMNDAAPLTPPSEGTVDPEKRPPMPPRTKPPPISTDVEAEDSLRVQKLYFGAQQDVTEVIGNVMFRLQCAIKPTSIDPKFGEQIDNIRETFYGANAVHLKKSGSYDVKVEDWASIIVFPGLDGPRDIYEALDVVFDEQVVEIDNTTTTQFGSIHKLPPIVQVQIQRTAFDPVTQQASKNQNRIVFDETIYLDRYMNDDRILQRRRDSWRWKNRIRQLESRQRALQVTEANISVTDALNGTKEFISTLQELGDPEIPVADSVASLLEARAAETSSALASWAEEIASLKAKLREQYTDLRQHRYRLQSVFIHRGTNAYGHYWIYIYDFANDVWREYNDERVSVVEDRSRVFQQSDFNSATPYYLVYVRDDDKEDLVDAVVRELPEEPPIGADNPPPYEEVAGDSQVMPDGIA